MEINLDRLQAGELQMICREMKHKQKMVNALNTFDSSNMSLESQLNHSLMKLTESVKGNIYNSDIERMAEAAERGFMRIADTYFIDDIFAPILALELEKEIEHYKKAIDYYKSPECAEFSRDKDNNSRNTYVTNYSKRLEAIEDCFNKIVAQI